jgi:hypothetical protein
VHRTREIQIALKPPKEPKKTDSKGEAEEDGSGKKQKKKATQVTQRVAIFI